MEGARRKEVSTKGNRPLIHLETKFRRVVSSELSEKNLKECFSAEEGLLELSVKVFVHRSFRRKV